MTTETKPRAHESPIWGVRVARGLTQEEVAKAARLHQSTLSMAERGLVQLSIPQLYRLGGVLGLTEVCRHLKPFVIDGEQEEAEAEGQE